MTRAAEFARAVDRAAFDRSAELDELERAAVLARIDTSGDLRLCPACAGSGWAPVVGESPRRHVLCEPCRGFGAVAL